MRLLLAGILGVALGASESGRSVAVTFDDLPGVPRSASLETLREMNERLLTALKSENVPAVGFVNERWLHVDGERDSRASILRGWLEAGMSLGNHTFAHRGINDTPLALYQDDVVRGEVVTRRLMEEHGLDLTYFRHPYTHTGPTAEIKESFERFLAERAYRVAPFTVETADFVFAALYEDARKRGDAELGREIEDAYLEHNDRMFEWFELLARETFGREIPQILLIHVNRLNAAVLPRLVEGLRRRGYRFVTLDEALADEAYATPDGYVGRTGPSWLHRWGIHRGSKVRREEEPDPPAWILERYSVLER